MMSHNTASQPLRERTAEKRKEGSGPQAMDGAAWGNNVPPAPASCALPQQVLRMS